jgi:hypothetical protein
MASSPPSNRSALLVLITGISALIALIGSFLPWAYAGEYSVRGTVGGGMFTLVLSAIALIMVFWATGRMGVNPRVRTSMGIAFACMLLVALIGIINVADIQQIDIPGAEGIVDIGVSPGLWMVTILGVVGTLSALVALIMGGGTSCAASGAA